MTRMVMVFALMLCALFQAILPEWTSMGQAKAPILLGGVLYYALTRDGFLVVEAAFMAGIFQDSLGPIPFGFSVIAFCFVALLSNHFRDRVFSESWVTHVLIGMTAALIVTLILYILLVSSGERVLPLGFVSSKAWGTAFLGVPAIPLTFKAIEWLDVKLGNVELKEL